MPSPERQLLFYPLDHSSSEKKRLKILTGILSENTPAFSTQVISSPFTLARVIVLQYLIIFILKYHF